jgi:predicted Zn-dependent peptidase
VKHISDNGGRRNGATGFTYTYYYFKVFAYLKNKLIYLERMLMLVVWHYCLIEIENKIR